MMKLCPKCGSLASLNSYFGAYICENCTWMDSTFDYERIEHNSIIGCDSRIHRIIK